MIIVNIWYAALLQSVHNMNWWLNLYLIFLYDGYLIGSIVIILNFSITFRPWFLLDFSPMAMQLRWQSFVCATYRQEAAFRASHTVYGIYRTSLLSLCPINIFARKTFALKVSPENVFILTTFNASIGLYQLFIYIERAWTILKHNY